MQNSFERARTEWTIGSGLGASSLETLMPDYEISCHKDDGTTVLQYAVQCSGDLHARLLANSLRASAGGNLEVWRGDALIYAEPRLKPH
jgi:hypothetical protein